jgi:hypothetical protein
VEKSFRSAGASGDGFAEFVVRVAGEPRTMTANEPWPHWAGGLGTPLSALPQPATWMDGIQLPGPVMLVNEVQPVASMPKANFDQRIYVHQDGTYGWSWDRRASPSDLPSACGVRFPMRGFTDTQGMKEHYELDLDVVTRLENDQGNHNLAAVVWLTAAQAGGAAPKHKVTVWFDWYGPASDVQTVNDGYRDYGYVSGGAEEYQYRIKGFRGAPPRVNLTAILDDATKRIGSGLGLCGLWFGNEIWNGSRGATLVRRLDCVIGTTRYSSTPSRSSP